MHVVAAGVPRVKRVETNHGQSLLRQLTLVVLEYAVQVLIVAPRHHQIGYPALGLVDAVLGAATEIPLY